MIRSYLSDIINDYRTQGEWKSQFKILDEIIEELFQSLLQKYQKDLEESIRGSEFIFDGVDLFFLNLIK